jgi:predicted PurR-regulated permease PerM
MSTERRASPSHRLAHPSRATAALTIGVIALVAAFLYLVRNALIPFVFAGVIAFVATPAIDWAAARTRLPRWLFALLTLLLLIGVFVLIGWLGVPSLAQQLTGMGSNLQGSIADIVAQFIGKDTINLFGKQTNAQMIAKDVIDFASTFLSTHAFTLVEYTFAGMFGIILAWVLLGYMLFGGSAQGEALFWLLPPSRRDFAKRVWAKLSPILRRYFLGVLLVVIYASVAAYIGLGLILNIHNALFLALLTGLLEIIPVIGPVASGTIAGLVAIGQAQSSWNIVEYIIYAIALRISIDEFFGPIVLGKAAYLRPVLVIFCFLAGGMLFGIVGVVMAVPVALAVKAILGEVYHEQGLRQDEASTG